MSSNVVVSPYVNPKVGKVFAYGKFCGPSLPAFAGAQARTDREKVVRGLTPADYIDAACRAHDICYELYSHDNPFCDYMFTDVLYLSARKEPYIDAKYKWVGSIPDSACKNLYREIITGINYKKTSKAMKGFPTTKYKATDGVPIISPMLGVALNGSLAALTAPSKGLMGWPSPGQCYAQIDDLKRLKAGVNVWVERAFSAHVCVKLSERPESKISNEYAKLRWTVACDVALQQTAKGRLPQNMLITFDDKVALAPTPWSWIDNVETCWIQSAESKTPERAITIEEWRRTIAACLQRTPT